MNETKQCRYCRQEIDAEAKICPYCRKTLNFSIGRVLLVVLIIVLGYIVLFAPASFWENLGSNFIN